MLPRNIDLTEHRDFGGGNVFILDTIIEIPIDEYHLMTPDEYDHLMWWEGIFGRRRHYTEKSKVFDVEKRFESHWNHHCLRCGVALRIPWKTHNGLCKKCDDIVSLEEGGTRIPWKRSHKSLNEGGHRDPKYDLFNSR